MKRDGIRRRRQRSQRRFALRVGSLKFNRCGRTRRGERDDARPERRRARSWSRWRWCGSLRHGCSVGGASPFSASTSSASSRVPRAAVPLARARQRSRGVDDAAGFTTAVVVGAAAPALDAALMSALVALAASTPRTWRGGSDALAAVAARALSRALPRPADRRRSSAIRALRGPRGAVPADADGDRQRHGAVLHGPRVRPPAARAGDQPEEDDRRRDRRVRVRRGCCSPCVGAWWLPGVPVALSRAARPGDRRARHHRRSVRVDAEAQRRREGQLGADSRATAACSIASTRCCSPRRSIYVVLRSGPWRSCMKRIAILGSTGSIGQSALAVVDAHPDRLQVVGAGRGRERRAARPSRSRATGRASRRWRPATAIDRLRAARRGRRRRRSPAPAATGSSPSRRIPTSTSCSAPRAGTAALEAVLAAIEPARRSRSPTRKCSSWPAASSRRPRARSGVAILPVDSEHNAIHQCLHGRARARGRAPDPHRVRRTVPRPLGSRAGRRHRRRRAAASDVADGPQDHDRLGDADEQGARGDRGALAVRRAGRPDRRRRFIRSRSCIRWWS